VDTAFPIEAYSDISFQVLNKLGFTGSRLYDIRYFYTSSDFFATQGLGDIILNNLGTPTSPASNPFTKQSWDNANPAQFTAALQQIGMELQNANKSQAYFGTVQNAMASANGTIFADMIGMAKTISDALLQSVECRRKYQAWKRDERCTGCRRDCRRHS
jgi:flagellin-like hook-associated protein FlgL